MEKIVLYELFVIAWKGAAPTGARKRAGSATEDSELPPKKSKKGINISLIYSLLKSQD